MRSFFCSSKALLPTTRNAGLLTEEIDSSESGVSVGVLQQGWQPQGMGTCHTANLGAPVTHGVKVSVSSSPTRAHTSPQLFLFCFGRSPGVGAVTRMGQKFFGGER